MIKILGIPIRMYGILAALGIYLGTYVSSQVIKKSGYKEDLIWDAFIWALIPGIIGARLYHVIDLWGYYSKNVNEIIAVWQGGIGIFGAVIGGLIGLSAYWYFKLKPRKNSTSLATILDAVVIGLPLGQSIGRWGNFFNQELYGAPTDLPWAITIDIPYRIPGYETIARYHPLFLYESILNLALFGLMMFLFYRRNIKLGRLYFVALYAIGYGLIRYSLEPIRLEKWTIGNGLPMAQLVSAGMIVVGLGILINLKFKNKKAKLQVKGKK